MSEVSASPPAAANDVQRDALLQGRLGDPFAFLGPHATGKDITIRTFQPGAAAVHVRMGGQTITLNQHAHDGLFAGTVTAPNNHEHLSPSDYTLDIVWPGANGDTVQSTEDVYAFGLLLGELDLHLIAEGRHRELGRCLGAIPMTVDGVEGTRFAVWAPNARRVSVVGDFNSWDGRRHPMRSRSQAGVWELFIPRLGAGERYKYELLDINGQLLPLKADPIARATELPPATSSVVAPATAFRWTDAAWMKARADLRPCSMPMSVYEVHAASWLRVVEENNRNLDWHELGDRLIPYALEMGFTHLEFLPVMEHPFSGSWGYQPLSQFAPSARFSTPAAFAGFVDRCHNAGLGVILDWVPAHFPSDAHGLAHFDGTALYEHADPREGFHQDWNTLIYNFGRNEVRGFLIASALEWLEHFHIDGLRVDAVASMLYRDYSRKAGEWIPNIYGGRENLEAVAFLKELNEAVTSRCPGALMIAEESTAWPGVTAPVNENGLGFSFKWNMGWMHDTLRYIEHDPVHRRHHHNDMTFGMVYAYSEHFVLPISHDEVVHGKGSLLGKMPGDDWQKLANLRAYLGFMWTHPGKKLLFMGSEFGQLGEWNHDASPEWHLLDDPRHRGVQRLVRDLNHFYVAQPALHESDCQPSGFRWIIGDDADNSVLAYLRMSPNAPSVLIVCNMTPVPRTDYCIGVPEAGNWEEVINSDAAVYGGSNIGNAGGVSTINQPAHGYAQSLVLTLPPLSTVIFRKNP
ncbi:1,4-alpha-glucan branching protein GlgB [Oxalicibacterium faecigallinarum]|uniref:1,4-alpha-glucan branching enzyme GlgB n=1 Tax=Oxalicibacterium faecigallinarum TaxID=573741 RepID=A0A8J3ARM0_9BURK|nr:1,4-alpha-glucan branching protein GlgB [Oxalicibacterium faecigallinarum]GGI20970.1 1,4-alpha-glucan branching enzyme GlgB 1 [Oxalicibacterium faecigallinarum]